MLGRSLGERERACKVGARLIDRADSNAVLGSRPKTEHLAVEMAALDPGLVGEFSVIAPAPPIVVPGRDGGEVVVEDVDRDVARFLCLGEHRLEICPRLLALPRLPLLPAERD